MYFHALLIRLPAALAVMLTAACATMPDPEYLPTAPAAPVAPARAPESGAIFQTSSSMRLFEDLKARRVGDTLTITLVEATEASKANNTSTSKETDVAIDTPTLLGSPVGFDVRQTLGRALQLQNRTGNSLEIGLGSGHGFDGSGSASQSASLQGSVTVTVAEVLPNGNLLVRGEKLISLNQGDEYVRIRGIVRPVDIDASNTVQSTKVAHAQITYGGEGAVQDASRHGWLSRFFLKYWPF